MGDKIDKDANQDGPDKGCEEEGTFEGSEKGQDSIINYHLGWINDDSKRCLVVEDANLKLESEEWLIRRHLE